MADAFQVVDAMKMAESTPHVRRRQLPMCFHQRVGILFFKSVPVNGP